MELPAVLTIPAQLLERVQLHGRQRGASDPASEKSIQVMDAAADGGALPGELWRHTAPYRGLAAGSKTARAALPCRAPGEGGRA